MRILIAGTGGIGGYYGARLAATGNDVEFLARGAMLEALRTNGLELRSDLGAVRLEHVHATDRPEHEAPAEAVMFCVKSYDNAEAADAIEAAVARGTIVCSLQNGVDNERFLMERFPEATVLGGTSRIEAYVVEPGVVAQRGEQSQITLGAFTTEERPAAAHLGAAFDRAGVPIVLSSDIRSALWQKLVIICGFGGITAYSREPMGGVLADERLVAMLRALWDEAQAVGRAKGVEFPDGMTETLLSYAATTLKPGFKSSMARDVDRGRPLEVEALNGAVVRAGAETGISTPANRTVLEALLPLHREALARRRAPAG